jgi:microcystin-dependent protein
MSYAGPTAPQGWLLCDGAAVSRTDFAALFTAIGTGWGNGTTEYPGSSDYFNIPDLRAMFLRGLDTRTTGNEDPDGASRTERKTGGNTGWDVGSYQSSANKDHNHNLKVAKSGAGGVRKIALTDDYGFEWSSDYTSSSGASDSRPKNVYVVYIIKY